MHSVPNVSPVSASGRGVPIHRASASTVTSTQTAKPDAGVRQSGNLSVAQTPPANTQPGLPLGFLLSVSRPASSNTVANTDYLDMQNALHSGNLAAAQQAYLRLQTDLLAAYSSAATAVNGGNLNASA